jgi:hypothetical protein
MYIWVSVVVVKKNVCPDCKSYRFESHGYENVVLICLSVRIMDVRLPSASTVGRMLFIFGI